MLNCNLLKRHTPKILVSVVLSRPEKKKGVGFYGGKVALLRCTKTVQAKKKSKNYKRGQIYKKDSTLNSSMYKTQLTRNIFPQIKKDSSVLDKSVRFATQPKLKCPSYSLPDGCKWADVYLQLDNAPPHCKRNKKLFAQITKAAGRNTLHGNYYGPKVRLSFQPPDSPDLNVLDLGFFEKFWTKTNRILRKNHKMASLDEIWEAAKSAWDSITSLEIEILFQTWRARMRQVIECEGRNDMDIPHEGIRERVEAEDILLKSL